MKNSNNIDGDDMESWYAILSKINPTGIPLAYVSSMNLIPKSGEGMSIRVEPNMVSPSRLRDELRKLVDQCIIDKGEIVVDFTVDYQSMITGAEKFASKMIKQMSKR